MAMKNSRGVRMRNKCGQAFTLIEVMIVVLIISVILNMALPSFIQARDNTQTKTCITNLRHIQDAKEQWSIVAKQPDNATPLWSDLAPYVGLNASGQLTCPTNGGNYTINNVDTEPTCNSYPVTHGFEGD